MFLTNKYSKWYYNIINNATTRERNGYTEKHHIIPKSLGGSNSIENLVRLTGKEHYICHLLLVKMTIGDNRKKMLHAIWSFIRSSKNQNRQKITGKRYERIRQEFSQMLSESRKGVLNVGRIVSNEQRKKLSEASKGKLKSTITKERMKLAWTTRDRTVNKITREKLAKSVSNFWELSEHRQQQSDNRKNFLIKNPKVLEQQVNNLNNNRYTCKYCGTTTNKGNYSRWHNTNCKGYRDGKVC